MIDLLVNYRSVLEHKKRQREAMIKAFQGALRLQDNIIADLERTIRGLESEQPDATLEFEVPASVDYKVMSRGDASVEFLRSKGKPQKTAVIAAGLTRGGLHSSYLATYKALLKRSEQEHPDIVKVGKSEWGLSEWISEHRAA